MTKTYAVVVTDVLERTIMVQASSANEAVDKAIEMRSSGVIKLDSSDYVDTSYQVVEA